MLPFLKWAGGKRWLVQGGQLPIPSDYKRLVEPFLGGAAVFFALEPSHALLSDLNPELIELYNAVKEWPEDLAVVMKWHHEKHSSDHYYRVRGREYNDPLWRAARTLYLNRTCWNGLYRLNKNGRFNVPLGTKTQVIYAEEDFCKIAEVLRRADILCQDFQKTIDGCGTGDLLFVDPPYTVKHNLNGFLKYNETIFSWDDQIRLRDCLQQAVGRGASVIVTNADHACVRELYSEGFLYSSLARQSVLSGRADRRGPTTEALFTGASPS